MLSREPCIPNASRAVKWEKVTATSRLFGTMFPIWDFGVEKSFGGKCRGYYVVFIVVVLTDIYSSKNTPYFNKNEKGNV